MAQNSCTKHLKLLKKIINLSVANAYISFNPFTTYKVEREPVEVDFLDEEELRKIINFDTPLPRLERAKDMFLFGCFTGLSYIDIKTLTYWISTRVERNYSLFKTLRTSTNI